MFILSDEDKSMFDGQTTWSGFQLHPNARADYVLIKTGEHRDMGKKTDEWKGETEE